MAGSSPQSPILQTKLYPPVLLGDLLCRKRLHDQMDAGIQRPLTLVAAPAGYGKSTAVAHWLETSRIPSAWVSLDEGDGELRIFLQYLLTAVQGLFPEACTETQALLEEMELPPVAGPGRI